MQAIKTTCPYCGVGCGLQVQVKDDEITVRGDKKHPANFGRLCSKGAALATTLDLTDRLLDPVIYGEKSNWNDALDHVAHRFNEVIQQHGPDAVAFYVSGQLLTEDYYVANKLMKGFIGSGNIDTNSRLCMSSSVVGHKRAFGSDTVPGCYEDWDNCDVVVLTGSNTAWCHPVLFQRLVVARKNNPSMKVVVIDPRRTATCDIADLHLPLSPGSDAYLFNGLLNWLDDQGHTDQSFIDRHTENLEETLRLSRKSVPALDKVAEVCGLDMDKLITFYRWFAENEKTVTVYSQGINQSTSGSDKVNAIINCHLLTGRIGKPGMGPFSVTGQPNAMGGREVGALSNQLAAHMDYENKQDVTRVAQFWSASNMSTKPGLKAIDLFKAVKTGKIKALWVMATNPAASMPEAGLVQEALKSCEFLVVSDCTEKTDTTLYADVLLPALTWGEKSGTVTNSERCISRQRAFLDQPGEARADWWIISQVAQRMGYAGFSYQHPRDIFIEHAALSAYENNGTRDFDLSGLIQLSQSDYEQMEPIQWPVYKDGRSQQRLFSQGEFFYRSKKARFIGVTPSLPASKLNEDYPLVLNTGRVRDQWHTMTRTGKSPRLNNHISEPFVQMHPQDAAVYHLHQGQLIQVESKHGQVIVRGEITEDQRPGSVFIPMHWNQQNSACGGVGKLVNAVFDPFSGQPEFKHTPVRVRPYNGQWHGFILSKNRLATEPGEYRVRTKKDGFWHYDLSESDKVEDWQAFRRKVFPVGEGEDSWSELLDSTGRSYRAAQFKNNQLHSCIFINDMQDLPSKDWLMSLFSVNEIERSDRLRILAAAPASQGPDEGKVICSCFNVGQKRICNAIENNGLKSADQVGERLQAGTNCGSCIPEINALLSSCN